MREILYSFIRFITEMHEKILTLNDSYETTMTDKQLHFWVIGLVGMGILLVIYPLFILLSKKHVLVIAWLYVFTLMVVITFAIEIGQGYSGNGTMDTADIISGLSGFMLLFIIFAIIRFVFLAIVKAVKGLAGKDDE